MTAPTEIDPSCLATIKSRVLAYLVDLLIAATALLLASQILHALNTSNLLSIFGISAAIAIVLGVFVYQAVSLSLTGQSIGKKAMKLRVVTFPDASNPGFARAVFKRWWLPSCFYFVPYFRWVFGVADCLFVLNHDRRCLHDLIAGTQVIQLAPRTDLATRISA